MAKIKRERIIAIFFILLVINLFLYDINPKKEHNLNGLFKVNGNSMYPTLQQGDIVGASPIISNLTESDIIIYENYNMLVVHRIIGIGEDYFGRYYIVKGDHNLLIDNEKVRLGDIIGVLNG